MKKIWLKALKGGAAGRAAAALAILTVILGLPVFALAPAYAEERSADAEQSTGAGKGADEEQSAGQDAEQSADEERAASVSGGRRELYCTVLGDSIAKGYSGEKSVWIECYGRLAVKKLAFEQERRYTLKNFAKNGLDSEGMNEKILSQKEVLASVEKSDIIFITSGSNDLLNECKSVVQDILKTDTKFKSADEALAVLEDSVKKNPLLVLKVIDALGNWDYHSFETQWTKMMGTVADISKDSARIIVTDIYNPVVNMKLPSTMNQVVEDIIANMNSIIYKYADKYGYEVAKVSESAISAHVQKDGLHPDQMGQQMIAELMYEAYKRDELKR